MDNLNVNDLRTIITVISFVLFIGIVYWALSSHQRAAFEEAANLPFADAELPGEIAAHQTLTSKENNPGVRS
ncbi:MAG: cbb3-type cytochrome c oxidase subunit 3 [Usitatibacteraceae bacterium]